MPALIERGRALLQRVTSSLNFETPGTFRFRADAGSMIGPHVGASGYMRANNSAFLARWFPQLRDSKDEVRAAWVNATARAMDVVRNSGWIAGGIRSSCGQVVGSGLRLSPQPDTTVVKFDGLTDDSGEPIDADGWSRFVQRRFEQWANDPRECDARARQTIAQMTISAYKTWFATGEIVALIPHREDGFAMSSTKVLLVPPHRLTQKTDPMNRIFQGVRMDEKGRPVSYIFQQAGAMGLEEEVPIAANDAVGRPQVIHVYEGEPTQVRGITCLVPALERVRQFDQLAGSTLMAAMIQTIFAATVESDLPTGEVMHGLDSGSKQGIGGGLESFVEARMGWNMMNGLDLGQAADARVAHLFPGEKLKFNRSEHPNTTYEDFAKFLLREIAKACGVSFSQLTGDYTGVTYTGVRMEGTDNWQITLDRRNNIVARFLQPIYEAWLEEEIETGRIKFPGGFDEFVRLRGAACRASWRGPPKPTADDVKAAKVHDTYRQMGVMSDEMIANDLGVEISDVYAQRQRERKMREKYELDDVGPSQAIRVAEIQAEDEEDPEETPERNAA